MTLQEFLRAANQSPSAFAAQIQVPPSTVSRWLSGKRLPSLGQVVRIQAATNGAVTADDFLPTPSTETA